MSNADLNNMGKKKNLPSGRVITTDQQQINTVADVCAINKKKDVSKVVVSAQHSRKQS